MTLLRQQNRLVWKEAQVDLKKTFLKHHWGNIFHDKVHPVYPTYTYFVLRLHY